MDKILNTLGEAWNQYLTEFGYQATPEDTDDLTDFRKEIHDAQLIVQAKRYRAWLCSAFPIEKPPIHYDNP